jgi:hypothetical protein
MTPRWFFSVALFGALFFVPAASRAEAVGPLIRSSNNPNYFAKPDGTPVYLTGSHQWTNLQDGAATFPPAGIDYTAYVNWMQNNQFNFIRMWVSAEQPYSGLGGKAVWYNDPLPYTRPGPGVAADGKAKFNISSLNQKYFDRLRARVIAAGGDSVWVWKSFMRGLNPIFMDDLGQTGINLGGNTPFFDPAWYAVRTGMTQTARYAARLDLKNAKPNGNLSSTGYMLANPGTQYLAFAPSGGGFTINLSAGSGNNFSVEWFNVSTGAVTTSKPVSGGSSNQSFAQPFTGPAVLFLY